MRKLFVAMAGNIGAGKTTAAKLLSQHFGFELFDEPVVDNRFLADYYRDMRRWSFTLQLEFLIKRVQHHELIHRVPKSCIQDRTLYEDPEVFAKYLHGLGNMTDRMVAVGGTLNVGASASGSGGTRVTGMIPLGDVQTAATA